MTALGEVLSEKRLELLKDAVPGVSRVAVLTNPTSPYTEPFLKQRESAARTLTLQLQLLEVQDANKLDQAFAAMAGERAGLSWC